MAHETLGKILENVKNLRFILKKSKQKQIQSNTEKDHIKAVALSWFSSYKKNVSNLISLEDLRKIDHMFQNILGLAEKSPSRNKTIQLLKTLSLQLTNTRNNSLLTPFHLFSDINICF